MQCHQVFFSTITGATHSNIYNNCKHHGGTTPNGFMHQTSKPDNVFWSECARRLMKKRYDQQWKLVNQPKKDLIRKGSYRGRMDNGKWCLKAGMIMQYASHYKIGGVVS